MAMEYKQEELNLPVSESGQRWYTIREMADILGVTQTTIHNRIKKIDTSSHIRQIRTNRNILICIFDEYVFKYVSAKSRKRKKTVVKNESASSYGSDTTKVEQENVNLQVTESDYKWYTVEQMAKIVGISYKGMWNRLKKLDTASHKRYIRSKDTHVRMVIYDEYIFKLVSYAPLPVEPTPLAEDLVHKNEVIPKYESEITKLKQEVQREKNKRTECLEKYSKHLDYIVSIKNEYSSMQRQIAYLTAENNELKAELARKPVWRKLFA